MLIALWIIALIGTLFKLVFINRFHKISLIAYLVMGWLAVLVMDDMQAYLSSQALTFLLIGGIAYTVGALFLCLKTRKIYPRNLACICLNWCRRTLSGNLSVCDLTLNIAHVLQIKRSDLNGVHGCSFVTDFLFKKV